MIKIGIKHYLNEAYFCEKTVKKRAEIRKTTTKIDTSNLELERQEHKYIGL